MIHNHFEFDRSKTELFLLDGSQFKKMPIQRSGSDTEI